MRARHAATRHRREAVYRGFSSAAKRPNVFGMRLVRSRLLAVLTLLAFAAALASFAVTPAAMAQPCPEMAAPADHHGSMPSTIPDCGHASSCILMLALPAASGPILEPFGWSHVRYAVAPDDPTGVTISPDPSPPRSRA